MLDTSTPSLARACDHLLGGGASFAADRALATRLLELYPGLREVLSASRAHAADCVAHAARHGVRQYLDIGAGLPTSPSTHESARSVLSAARTIYVDRDPAVVEHGAALVPPGVRYVRGELAEPEALLADLSHGYLDLRQPVCLVLGLVLQALDRGLALAVVSVLIRGLPAGSYVVATVGAGESGRLPGSLWPGGAAPGDLASFFGGLDLVPPGVRNGAALCAMGLKRAATHG